MLLDSVTTHVENVQTEIKSQLLWQVLDVNNKKLCYTTTVTNVTSMTNNAATTSY